MPRRKRKRRRTGARRAAEQQQEQQGQHQEAQSDNDELGEEEEDGDSGVDVEASKRRRGEAADSDEEEGGEGALGTEEEEENDNEEDVLSRSDNDNDNEDGDDEEGAAEQEENEAEAEAGAGVEQGPPGASPPPPHSLRAWFPPPSEGGQEEGVYIGLQPGEALAVVGSALLLVVQGRAEALGYEMTGPTATPVTLHSPKWLSSLVIHALPSTAAGLPQPITTNNPLLAFCPTVLHFLAFPSSKSLPRFLTAAADAESSLLSSASGTRGLPGRVEPAAVVHIPGCLLMEESTLTGRLGLRPLAVPGSWQTGAEEVLALARHPPTLHNGPVVAVCGGKGTGKSTLTRYLTHRLLSSLPDESGVLYLDLDLGQPETTPPGLVSLSLIRGPLLGPPHTHMASALDAGGAGDAAPAVVTTLRSYFLGDVTSRHEPGMYSAAVQELLALHKADPQLKGLPLLVNMDGWVRGLGLELLTLALAALQPDLILRIEGKQRAAQFALIPPQGSRVVDVAAPGDEEEAAAAADSNEAEGAEGNGRRRGRQPKGKGGGASAPDLRTLRLVAYFLSSCTASGAEEGPFSGAVVTRNGAILDPKARVAGALAAQPPYRAPWGHVSLAVLHEPVPLHETLRAMDASIVGVLALPLSEGQEQGHEQPHPPVTIDEDGGELAGLRVYGPFSATPGALPPPAPLAACLGLGILRGVDRTRQRLHLLTPLPLETLRGHRILLARGALQLPLVALYNPTGHAAPYLSSELTSAEGASQLRNRAGMARR